MAKKKEPTVPYPINALPSASLFYQEGASDKVYQAQLQQQGDGFVVNFQYGRRGSALTAGSKTTSPVGIGEASEVYDELVRSKMAKGYGSEEGSTPFQGTSKAGRITGHLPQLLNAITRDEVERYINDPAWSAWQKADGERRMCERYEATIRGINRTGLEVPLPMAIADALQSLSTAKFVIDAEIIDNTVYVFDVLVHDGIDQRSRPFSERIETLTGLLAGMDVAHLPAVKVLAGAYTAAEKRALFDRLEAAEQEGIVFKRNDAPYTVGRPASGGTQVKFKFCESATLEVTNVNSGKRSVAFHGYDDKGAAVPLGNVTILPNFDVPTVGTFIEVRYLNANLGGSLFQPEYKGVRNDMGKEACNLAQLKYKADHVDISACGNDEKIAHKRRMAP